MSDWKRRKKYKPSQIKIENKQNTKKFNISKLVKREAMFTVLSVITVTILTLSSTYAIFSSVQKAEKYNKLKTGTLEISYEDTDAGMGNIINLNGAYPESDEEGRKTNPYTFTITNVGSLTAKYKIKILDDEEMIAEDGCVDNLLPKDKIKYSLNGGTPQLLSEIESTDYNIYEGLLGVGISKNYSIRIWIDESAGNEVLGTHYHGKIVVESLSDQAGVQLSIDTTTTQTTTNWGNLKYIGEPAVYDDAGGLDLSSITYAKITLDKNIPVDNEYYLNVTIKDDFSTVSGAVCAYSNSNENYPIMVERAANNLYVYAYYSGPHRGTEPGILKLNVSEYQNQYMNIQISAVRAGETKVYINGELKSTFASGSVFIEKTQNTFIVGDLREGRALFYNGVIYNLTLLNTVQGEEDIQANWNKVKTLLNIT